jgi:hypothetical protein
MDFGILIVVGLAFYLGWFLRGVIVLSNLSEDPDKVIKILEKIKKINEAEEAGFDSKDAASLAKGIKVRAEVIGDIFYLYTLEDDQFVAQGKSMEDAFKTAQKRFPGKSIWLEKKDISNQTA